MVNDLYRQRASELVAQMTLEEKASLSSGAETFRTQSVPRLGVPSFNMADGPHGLRKQEGTQDFLGKNPAVTATCFPAACLTGSGFDPDLMEEMGRWLGQCCQSRNVQVLLGPGINIKRSPLCGRNFEYFSEDPLVSGILGAAYVRGVQSAGVGACVKHFLANNQETRRRTQSSELDERTLREIYAPAFEKVVKDAQPWAVMSSYNKVNGTYVNESPALSKHLLRGEWGFDGMMVSDWAAVHDRIAVIKGGCSLTMPADKGNDQLIVQAVQNGTLDEKDLDECCVDIVALALKAQANCRIDTAYDFDAAHAAAAKIAAECMVLLKNEDSILPLDREKKIAIIGKFAFEPRYQGAGSSKVNPYYVPTLPDITRDMPNISYAQGFGLSDGADVELEAEAISLAAVSDYAVIVAGLPPIMEGEGYDRWVAKLPICQNRLIEKICDVQPNTIVILQNGGIVEMPWADRPKAILEAYLGGEAVSEALWAVLTGDVSPSGHLAETFPKRLEDNPCYLTWPGEGDFVPYNEGVFVGYRYYTSRDMEVLYPFGHGLTYTQFRYHDLQLSTDTFAAGETVTASVTVTNTGNRPGKALVQLYVGTGLAATGIRRPIRELRGFKKILLTPGESKKVSFILEKRAFAHWDIEAQNWRVAGGDYEIQIGTSARDIVLSKKIAVENEYIPTNQVFTILSSVEEVQNHPAGKAFFKKVQPMLNVVFSRIGMDNVQSTMPYAELRPKQTGFLSEPMQTVRRMLPMIPQEKWDALFAQLNQQ